MRVLRDSYSLVRSEYLVVAKRVHTHDIEDPAYVYPVFPILIKFLQPKGIQVAMEIFEAINTIDTMKPDIGWLVKDLDRKEHLWHDAGIAHWFAVYKDPYPLITTDYLQDICPLFGPDNRIPWRHSMTLGEAFAFILLKGDEGKLEEFGIRDFPWRLRGPNSPAATYRSHSKEVISRRKMQECIPGPGSFEDRMRGFCHNPYLGGGGRHKGCLAKYGTGLQSYARMSILVKPNEVDSDSSSGNTTVIYTPGGGSWSVEGEVSDVEMFVGMLGLLVDNAAGRRARYKDHGLPKQTAWVRFKLYIPSLHPWFKCFIAGVHVGVVMTWITWILLGYLKM
ncbi:hypothetical protein NM688_g3594 [Phlebia brevispora]|uniref:Uncharacterized protein n=1 Tax=Phlebia brevispora TaxID=194682 RepID=A0ACC1T592_9APHY|nr:hypothetical protein NM688_g3594 [Phlebia brevispora]